MKKHCIKSVGLFGVVASILILIGCDHRLSPKFFADKKHRVVTISMVSPPNASACEVDFPVTLLRIRKNDTIAWAADDHDYWIVFTSGVPVGGSPTVKVSQGQVTSDMPPLNLSSATYFKYAIYSADPGATPPPSPCKTDSDDRDTGLNVKP